MRQGAETINSLTEFVQLAKPVVFFLFLILITYPLLTNNSGSYLHASMCAPNTTSGGWPTAPKGKN